MVPGSIPVVHSLSLKPKSAFAKQISKAKEVRSRRTHCRILSVQIRSPHSQFTNTVDVASSLSFSPSLIQDA
jgi:hypothetical protein